MDRKARRQTEEVLEDIQETSEKNTGGEETQPRDSDVRIEASDTVLSLKESIRAN